MLYIDCESEKSYVYELKKYNRLIEEEQRRVIKIEFDIDHFEDLFDDSFFNKYLKEPQVLDLNYASQMAQMGGVAPYFDRNYNNSSSGNHYLNQQKGVGQYYNTYESQGGL